MILPPYKVRIQPATNRLGNSYYVWNGKKYEEFAYVWAIKLGTREWWQNLIFVSNANILAFEKLTDKLRKKRK